jgi:hypothetical protein
MARFTEALERRDQPRLRSELACNLLVDGVRHRGLVRDISGWGLFVQTPGELLPGSETIVAFRTPEGHRFVLEATVPHRRGLSNSTVTHCHGGVGLHIQDPPASYRRWVEELCAEE